MKIIFINHFIAGGGAERVTSLLSKKMVEKGHEVWLITDLSIPFAYKFDKNIHTYPLYKNKREKKSLLSFCYMIKNCRSYIKKEAADVIIGVLPLMNLVAIIASFGLRKKVIASEHTSFDRPLNWHIGFVRNIVYRFADVVTILTQADFNYLGSKLPNKVVMPNPLSYPCVKEKMLRRKNILAVGRLDVWYVKGFDILIEAWGMIAHKYPDWTLEIAGKGTDESMKYLQQISHDVNVEKQVVFLGFHSDIDNIMRQSSIFTLTSRHEGFGMVLLEAMSQGCACISFDCGGRQREIITNRNEGIIIEKHDAQELSRWLEKMIVDDSLRNEISKGGIERAKAFDLDVIVKRWEQIIMNQQTVINDKNAI